jgi:methionine biosynthesis protein MetW
VKKECYYSDKYERTPSENFDDRHRKVLRIFSQYGFTRILDVGCGDGNFSLVLGKVCRAKEVCGIEISPKGVELARKNGINAFQLDIDGGDFPFEDSYFDAVFCGEVIEHLFDPDHLLDEIHRVLTPEGVCVLTTPNLASWHNRISLLLGFQPRETYVSIRYTVGRLLPGGNAEPQGEHIRVFSTRALRGLLKIHGFTILKTLGATCIYTKRHPLLSLAIIPERIFTLFPSLSSVIIVVFKK